MRVTDAMRFHQVSRNLADISSQHLKASEQAATGLKFSKPSDDPLAAADLARLRASLSQATDHRQAVGRVRGDAELSESMLAEAGSMFQRLSEIATQGANGTLNAEDRTALADEVQGIQAEMLRVANTKGSRGYLFAGTSTDARPFSDSGVFSGNDADQLVQVGPGTSVRVNVSGAEAFTASGGRDVFADISALETALRTDDQSGVSAALDNITASRDQVARARSDAGSILKRLDTSDEILGQLEFDLTKRESDVGAVDPFEAYSNLANLGQAFERSVAVSQQVLSLGLLNRF